MNQDLVDYLIDCAREVKREPFVIRFTLIQAPDESKLLRIRRSVNEYFYTSQKANGKRFCRQMLGADRSVVANVFADGLTVAAWVSLRESLAVFLIEWFPHRKNILLYQRLANAKIIFRPDPTLV